MQHYRHKFKHITLLHVNAQGNPYDVLSTQLQSFLTNLNVLKRFPSEKIKLNVALDTQPSKSEYKRLPLYLRSKTLQLLPKLSCISNS